MTNTEPKIDAYIAKAAPFAQPVLNHFRRLVHHVCPLVQEKIKWGMPHFDYLDAPMAHMAAFKQHCAIGFWKASMMKDAGKLTATAKTEVAMGHLGKIESMKDLPKDATLKKYIRNAMDLNEKGVKVSRKSVADGVKVPKMPDYFAKGLKKVKGAADQFKKMTPGNKKEYINWVTEAKTETTRLKRVETAAEWISEGKIRNWKYLKK